MSSGQSNERGETQKQRGQTEPSHAARNWLRHHNSSQAALIDRMLLEGGHSLDDIADALAKAFDCHREHAEWVGRVRSHCAHLTGECTRPDARGVRPHGLRLTTVNGRMRFDC